MQLTGHGTSSRRARPLPPAARRAALIHATLPLVLRHGVAVSTRQIAAAARVAEGTIFRVFRDKDSLIQAAVDTAFDPTPVAAALERIDVSLTLEERLTEAVDLVQQWLAGVIHLMTVLRDSRACGHGPHLKRPQPSQIIGERLARLIEPDRARLAVPPAEAARLIRLLLFSGTHPGIADGPLLTPEQIVRVILEGIRAPSRARERA